MTLEDIRSQGFSDKVVEALRLLTHDPTVDYMDYIRAIKPNPVARKVKLADLRHNMDRSRYVARNFTDEERKRAEVYSDALAYLLSE